jgi:hypothetical protein
VAIIGRKSHEPAGETGGVVHSMMGRRICPMPVVTSDNKRNGPCIWCSGNVVDKVARLLITKSAVWLCIDVTLLQGRTAGMWNSFHTLVSTLQYFIFILSYSICLYSKHCHIINRSLTKSLVTCAKAPYSAARSLFLWLSAISNSIGSLWFPTLPDPWRATHLISEFRSGRELCNAT